LTFLLNDEEAAAPHSSIVGTLPDTEETAFSKISEVHTAPGDEEKAVSNCADKQAPSVQYGSVQLLLSLS
jgi:hypothetical protein